MKLKFDEYAAKLPSNLLTKFQLICLTINEATIVLLKVIVLVKVPISNSIFITNKREPTL